MSFRPLRVPEKRERELEEVPDQGMERPVAGGTKGKGLVLAGGCGPALRVGRCLFHRRLPKRGFTNIFRKEYNILNVEDLNRFEPNALLDAESFKQAGLIKKMMDGIKLLGTGEITHRLL